MSLRTAFSAWLAVLASVPAYAAPAPEKLAAEARAIVEEYQSTLKARLTAAMQRDGPAAAIGVCRQAAPEIGERVGGRHGWSVGRTSLRTRNPDNRPDPWERDVLQHFEAEHAGGAQLSDLERYTSVEDGDGHRFRYMKAIPTAPLCLACHGADLAPAVEAALARLYPRDRATGFREGDLRGAFSLSRPLDRSGADR